MTGKTLQLGEQQILCQSGETVLDALLREQVEINHSCKQGVCQSCLSRSLDGVPPVAAQHGLKDVLQQQSYFLACLCYPEQDMRIGLTDHADFR